MNLNNSARIIFLLLPLIAATALGEPSVGETQVLGPFTGVQARLHPDNVTPIKIRYYGTDLGFTYEHDGEMKILFGDTMATEDNERIEASSGMRLDDGFGTIDIRQWSDPASFSADNMPLIKLGQNPGTSEMSAIDPGHAMEGFKTPITGFSNGTDEYGLFYMGKPVGCTKDSDCSGGLTCDQGLGYLGEKYTSERSITLGCTAQSSAACVTDTMETANGEPVEGSGFCVDPSSSFWAESDYGRIGGMGIQLWVGLRDKTDPRKYSNIRVWLSNKFINLAARTINNFNPARDAKKQDYNTASGTGGNQRVFIWGRPAFIGIKATGRSAGLYFAYVDLPSGADYSWDLNYFTGVNADGIPQFSSSEKDAVALDLDSHTEGSQAVEVHDIVDQISVSWVEHLGKWVMFYGGGLTNLSYDNLWPTCGVLEFFTGPDCVKVEMGNGAIRMRTADYPWGPWTPPQDVIVGGDPAIPGSGQYGPGGMLRHPGCTAPDCAPHTAARESNPNEYGFFYAANIIEQWTRPAGDGVDIIWNVSTWDPYRVVLLRTRINP